MIAVQVGSNPGARGWPLLPGRVVRGKILEHRCFNTRTDIWLPDLENPHGSQMAEKVLAFCYVNEAGTGTPQKGWGGLELERAGADWEDFAQDKGRTWGLAVVCLGTGVEESWGWEDFSRVSGFGAVES